MPKLQEVFTAVAIVCHCYERLTVFRHYSALSKKRKHFSKYTSKIKKIEEGETKYSVWDFFSDNCIKQIDSMLPWVCSVIDHGRHQNVVLFSDTLVCGSCATSLFLPHFDAICDLLLNRRTATWNLFVK